MTKLNLTSDSVWSAMSDFEDVISELRWTIGQDEIADVEEFMEYYEDYGYTPFAFRQNDTLHIIWPEESEVNFDGIILDTKKQCRASFNYKDNTVTFVWKGKEITVQTNDDIFTMLRPDNWPTYSERRE